MARCSDWNNTEFQWRHITLQSDVPQKDEQTRRRNKADDANKNFMAEVSQQRQAVL
jgi:hypothetical protein